DRRRCGLGRDCRWRCRCRNDCDATAHQVGHQSRHAMILAFEPVILDSYVLATDVTGFSKPVAERIRKARQSIRRPAIDEPDHRHCWLLRACRERPRPSRAADQPDEVAPRDHSITSSARASTLAGISMPSALAALRLMISSYLVGACTGRSAGFSPLRMRST